MKHLFSFLLFVLLAPASAYATSLPLLCASSSPSIQSPYTNIKTSLTSTSLRALRSGSLPSSHPSPSSQSQSSFHPCTTPIDSLPPHIYGLLINQIPPISQLIESGLPLHLYTLLAKTHGSNILPSTPPVSITKLIAHEFTDRLVQILLAVAFISSFFAYIDLDPSSASSAGLKHFIEPIVILTILFINASIGVYMSKNAEASMNALNELQPAVCTVLRSSSSSSSSSSSQFAKDLIPGDVITLRSGDMAPADARILKLTSLNLKVDESSFTGESVSVSKSPAAILPNSSSYNSHSPPIIQNQSNMLFSGSLLTSGSCIALVTSIGSSTELGKISLGVASVEVTPTPLQMKLDEFASKLTKIIGLICILTFVSSIPRFNDAAFNGVWYKGLIHHLKIATSLGVAAIPEGLPAVITLVLSLSTKRMADKNVIVRRRESVETLGCTDVICTDKTGTLTVNKMKVAVLGVPGVSGEKVMSMTEFEVSGLGYDPRGEVLSEDYDNGNDNNNGSRRMERSSSTFEIMKCAALCNDAQIHYDGKLDIFTLKGEPTEGALSVLVEKLGASMGVTADALEDLADETSSLSSSSPSASSLSLLAGRIGSSLIYPSSALTSSAPPAPAPSSTSTLDSNNNNNDSDSDLTSLANAYCKAITSRFTRVALLDFNRNRKSMGVLVRSKITQQNTLYVKGAPDSVLSRCTHLVLPCGKRVKMRDEHRKDIMKQTSELARRPLRTIAMAFKSSKDLPTSIRDWNGTPESASKHVSLGDDKNFQSIEDGLNFLGLTGIKDPARPEVGDAILKCGRAGIRVIMITGDAKETAVAIARDVNIFTDEQIATGDYHAFEGREFLDKLESEQLSILKKGNAVFCRVEPTDKQKLIELLQKQKRIVAMTGDGINDAPALKQSSIGIAMGITGTAVAKEAADMVLMDDNFSSIVGAVEEGRVLYGSMQAFICFLISCNIEKIVCVLLATMIGVPEPLSAMHLLWVNLVTDGPPATALGFNPAEEGIMDVPPRDVDEEIMTKWLLLRYVLPGLYIGFASVGITLWH